METCCRVRAGATAHVWLLDTGNVAGVAKELAFTLLHLNYFKSKFKSPPEASDYHSEGHSSGRRGRLSL